MSAEILIIDDNSDIRFLISSLLKDRGFYIRQAANYNQALSEIDKKLPDVAIIDVKLDKGDNDGIELLTHIKKKDIDVPVIIISGHANIKMAVDSLKSGGAYYDYYQSIFRTFGIYTIHYNAGFCRCDDHFGSSRNGG